MPDQFLPPHYPPILTYDSMRAYIARKARYLMLWAVAGLLVGIGILLVTPARYEASFLIKMPTANALNEFGVLQPHLIKVVPPAFDAKKLLLKPELFSNTTLAACAFSDTNADRKALVKSIYATEADYGSSVLVAVRIPGKVTAQACAEHLVSEIITFANMAKNNYAHYVLQVNPKISPSSVVNTDAKLTAPIRVSDAPVSPRPLHLVLGLIFSGLLLGFLIDWVRCIFAGRNRTKENY
jgi:hypothetical protein